MRKWVTFGNIGIQIFRKRHWWRQSGLYEFFISNNQLLIS
jgi:hypothetical protein